MSDTPAPTPTPQGKLGDVPLQQAILGEVMRGAGTHGAGIAILLAVLWNWVTNLEEQIGSVRTDLGAQIAEVRREVGDLHVDVARIQARQEMPDKGTP